MKIGLISSHSFSRPGGVKRHILGLYQEFQKRGIDVRIIVPRRKKSEKYGKDVVLLGTSFPLKFSGSQADFCVNFNPLAIESLLKKEKFDIIHLHNFGFPSALQVLERSSSLNILTFHANIEQSKFFKAFPSLLYLFRQIAQWKIDGIIGVAPLTLKVFNNFKGPKTVIPNGIDLGEFRPDAPKLREPPFDDPQKIKILFVGRIEKRKGLIYLLRAYRVLEKKFPNLALVVVGEGELKEKCRAFIAKHELKNVYFKGAVSGPKLPSYYASSDIFCSPAIFGESFGLVLLEAMACGTPVAAFANRGYKELLTGKHAEKFMAKPGDWRGLAKKLEILVGNPLLREEAKRAGLAGVQEYSWPKVADRILEFYKFARTHHQKKERDNGFSLEDSLKKLTAKILDKVIKSF
ncbi:MAG: glycosyltransferase family 4 protein [Candidatus Nealsonbacteria bacterium]|nr:glycosyltransferase family 4 protein [Candidatus Nealsonbacteria bacterium]